jgi:hypothetical protein
MFLREKREERREKREERRERMSLRFAVVYSIS